VHHRKDYPLRLKAAFSPRRFRSRVFLKQMFVDTGKRWLRALWNCGLRGALAAGVLVRGFLGTIYAHRI
jgi:hypothetical protein